MNYNLIFPGNADETIEFAATDFVETAKKAIQERGFFAVALSGGSTPKAIFHKLKEKKDQLDWTKVLFFWGDERSVPPEHPDSNYGEAMRFGIKELASPSNIFRMVAEKDADKNAEEYEKLIRAKIGGIFDLIMLGMGEDGHTASLFPETEALKEHDKLVISHFVEKKGSVRMTLTYPCINHAKKICFYAIGANKADMLYTVMRSDFNPTRFPCQGVGTKENPANWIVDTKASEKLRESHIQ